MRRLFLGRPLVVSVVAALALTACGGAETNTTTPDTANNGLEKSTLTVGIVAVPDSAPIQIAIDKGFFKAEGLTVSASVETGGATATPKLVAGQLDAMLGNYVSLFSAQEKGVGKFKVVADSYQAAPDNFVLMANGDNAEISSPADLAGKKIAVNTLNGIGTLAVTATAKVAGVTIDPKQFVPMPLPDMGAALKNGTVDVIWVAEPFISANARDGAKKIADSMSGPMADFPIAGWVMSDDFVAKNPNTVAAFQRALAKAQQLAASDRKAIEEVLPKYTKIDAATAAVIALGVYSTTLSEARLQRVADTMKEYGYLQAGFDVKSLLHAPAAG
ncbi:ABC transporter substrate-binding protein [Acrocarpospora catenulata]|uniref:ABC transporter substrate-binding protein n=1 Tax=Acrocarpospora catenulata TaxID=2836182 RepID=UPI001BDA7474|nr:ABC transporter substrate-binding protein [Acrocarpospora catenulata]